MSAELRILDANANRAREALRVMEDIARFGLDDPALSADLKATRHRLREALARLASVGIDGPALLESRDTPGDLGTAIEGSGEASRTDLANIAAAAASRLGESLRSLEETAKLLPTAPGALESAWESFEGLRYAAYDLHRRLVLALRPSARQWRLCVLITEALCRHPWEAVAARAIAAGADCLQLREKSLDSGELLRRAERLVQIARDTPAPGTRRPSVIINDRAEIALLAGADGVHVGQSDLGVADVRRLSARPARRLLVGVSCSTLERAVQAVRDGADYLGLGPMFPSTTKAKPTLAGPGLISAVVGDPVASRVPHLAISGITRERAGELAAVGCRGIAVSAAVCGAEDVEGAVRGIIG